MNLCLPATYVVLNTEVRGCQVFCSALHDIDLKNC